MSETTNAQLQLTDIANAVQIIDFLVEKNFPGGWKTIKQVESTRERLVAFLNSIPQPQEETTTDAAVDDTLSVG